jgi:hypothetical protein
VLLRKEAERTHTHTKHSNKTHKENSVGERKAALAFLCTRAAPDYHLSSKSDQNCWRCRFYGIRFAFPLRAAGRAKTARKNSLQYTKHSTPSRSQRQNRLFLYYLSHLWRINSLIYFLLLVSSYCCIQVDLFNLIYSIMETVNITCNL